MRSVAIAVALAGCGGAAPATNATGSIAQHAPPGACLPEDHAGDPLALLDRKGDGATVCWGWGDGGVTAARTCFSVDAGAAITSKLPWKTEDDVWNAKPPEEPRSAPPAGQLELCNPKGCKRMRSPYPPGTSVKALALDDSGERALVVSFEGGADSVEFANVFELATGKRTVHIKLDNLVPDEYFGDESVSHSGRFANRALIVGEWPAGPGGKAILIDPAHTRARSLYGWGGAAVVLDARSLLVLEGKHLTMIDTDTLGDLASTKLPGELLGNPLESTAGMLQLPGGVLVASARPAQLAVFDPATRSLTRAHPVPVCAP